MMIRSRSTLALALIFCITALLAGCSGGASDDREMGQVEGKITVDGKPAGKGYTLYLDPEDSRGVVIEVNEDGTYSGEAVVGKNIANLSPPPSESGGHGETGGHGSQGGGVTYETQTLEVKSSGTTTQDLNFKKK